MTVHSYDTIIIGSGGGTKIAHALEKLGIKSALVERDKAGGTFLNRGCIPSKMIIYPSGVTSRLRKFRDMKIDAGDSRARFVCACKALRLA
jgi:dihydrolipoamide dehydrogenase